MSKSLNNCTRKSVLLLKKTAFNPVGKANIGIQIKPTTYEQTPEPHKWQQWMQESHKRFETEQGGRVFIVFSIKQGEKKVITNPEVVDEISQEIERLSQSNKFFED